MKNIKMEGEAKISRLKAFGQFWEKTALSLSLYMKGHCTWRVNIKMGARGWRVEGVY